jgi:hypothetical protein
MSLMLYRGATIEHPVEGMFSFVPARRAGVDDPRFRRPSVESPLIKLSSRQSTWGSKRPLPLDSVRGVWEGLRDQVLCAGLLLAVSLETPAREETEIAVGESARRRC